MSYRRIIRWLHKSTSIPATAPSRAGVQNHLQLAGQGSLLRIVVLHAVLHYLVVAQTPGGAAELTADTTRETILTDVPVL